MPFCALNQSFTSLVYYTALKGESHNENENLKIIMKVVLTTNKKVNILNVRFSTYRYASLKSFNDGEIGLVLSDRLCVIT